MPRLTPSGFILSIQASGSWDRTVSIWKTPIPRPSVQLKGHISWVTSVAFSPDGLQLASADSHKVTLHHCKFLNQAHATYDWWQMEFSIK